MNRMEDTRIANQGFVNTLKFCRVIHSQFAIRYPEWIPSQPLRDAGGLHVHDLAIFGHHGRFRFDVRKWPDISGLSG